MVFKVTWETVEGVRTVTHSVSFANEKAMRKFGRELEKQGISPVYVMPF